MTSPGDQLPSTVTAAETESIRTLIFGKIEEWARDSGPRLLDDRELELVSALQVDPRASWAKVGARVGVSASTASRMWQRLLEEGLGWVSTYPGNLVPWSGYLWVSAAADRLEQVGVELALLPSVFWLERTDGDASFFAGFSGGVKSLTRSRDHAGQQDSGSGFGQGAAVPARDSRRVAMGTRPRGAEASTSGHRLAASPSTPAPAFERRLAHVSDAAGERSDELYRPRQTQRSVRAHRAKEDSRAFREKVIEQSMRCRSGQSRSADRDADQGQHARVSGVRDRCGLRLVIYAPDRNDEREFSPPAAFLDPFGAAWG